MKLTPQIGALISRKVPPTKTEKVGPGSAALTPKVQGPN